MVLKYRWIMDDTDYEEYLLPHLKPYTQYAFYVQTYTVAPQKTGKRVGARSPIIYVRTKPSSKPRLRFTLLLFP